MAEEVKYYDPVKIEMTDMDGQTYSAVMEPLVIPANAILKTGEPTTGNAPLPLKHSIDISPVKLPDPIERTELTTPLLGAVGLILLGFGLDPKKKCLFRLPPGRL